MGARVQQAAGALTIAAASLFAAPFGFAQDAAAHEPAPESAVGEESTADRIDGLINRFYDPDFGKDERIGALEEAARLAVTWAESAESFTGTDEGRTAGLAQEAVFELQLHTGPWYPVEFVEEIQSRWFAALRDQLERGSAFAKEVWAKELTQRVDFLSSHVSQRRALDLLDEREIERALNLKSSWSADLLVLRANLRRLQGQFREARNDLDRAARIPNIDPEIAMSIGFDRASVELNLGRVDRCREHVRRIREATADLENANAWKAKCDSHDIVIALAVDENELAIRLCDDYLHDHGSRLTHRPGHQRIKATIDYLRILAMVRSGATGAELDRAIDAAESLVGTKSLLDRRAKQLLRLARVDGLITKGDLEPARAELSALLDPVEHDDSNFVSSRLVASRMAHTGLRLSRAERDASAIERALHDHEQALHRLIESWEEAPLLAGGVGFLSFAPRRRALGEFIDAAIEHLPDGETRAWNLVMRADACSSAAKRRRVRSTDALESVEYCRRERTCVVYLMPTSETLHRLVATSEGIAHDSTSLSGLDSHLRTVARELRSRPAEGVAVSERTADALAKLSALVIPACVSERSASFDHVLFAGLEMLGQVPLELLPLGDGEPLGTSASIYRTPSLALSMRGFEARALDGRRAVPRAAMFALTGVDHDLDRIDLERGEFESLTDATGSPIELVSRRGATTEGFLRSLWQPSDLFIAWTHGTFDRARPVPAGLRVVRNGNDGTTLESLWADEIEIHGAAQTDRGRAMPRVVFLASCGTARGHQRIGDGVAGHLGGTFLSLGTGAVVVSPANLDRDATMFFLREFSRAFVNEGASAAQAAMRARRALVGSKHYSHPHYWSSIQVIGDGRIVRTPID